MNCWDMDVGSEKILFDQNNLQLFNFYRSILIRFGVKQRIAALYLIWNNVMDKIRFYILQK